MIRITLILLCCCALFACTSKKSPNKFSDNVLVKIAEYQDRRWSDSLYQFFDHENAMYRRDAVLAFSSIQDTTAVDKIGAVLLNDPEADVRSAAAFSLGQIGTSKAFGALMDALVSEKVEGVSREIFEACGKTALKDNAIKHGNQVDGQESIGFAWSYYRLGLNGVADSSIVERATQLLRDSKLTETRLGLAHFFARGPRDILIADTILQQIATTDPSPEVRMAATSALRKIATPTTLITLGNILNDDDYRVRVNAIRALLAFPLQDTKRYLVEALQDSSIQVGITAAEILRSVITKEDWKEFVPLARTASNWRIQGILYEAILSASNDKEVAEEVTRLYTTQDNPYAKAALLTALGKSTLSYDFIHEQLHQSEPLVIKSTAASALVALNRHPEFNDELRTHFVEIYKKAFETGDAAVMGTIASALADSTLRYKEIIKDFTFLYEAKNKLSLPKDNEALQPLEAAIAHFEGRKSSVEVKNEFNHPIDWNLVRTIDKDQKVLIQTSKGEIIIRLLVEEAPGSVANFVQLLTSQYFDSKNFHRVVPNFVIQGGCNRGDGWGSEDYSIRSEFSMRRYTEGSVGMASAGKDTEGTQWFITHSPTPHLDGRYTIFAVVETGMDVVHRMEVGDMILKVELIK